MTEKQVGRKLHIMQTDTGGTIAQNVPLLAVPVILIVIPGINDNKKWN